MLAPLDRKRIAYFALGGTIATQVVGGKGLVPALGAADLVAAVPALSDLAEIQVNPMLQVPGPHLTFADIEALAAEIHGAVRAGADGVVISQGTDTIEETSFLLDRILEVETPVVITGAMRSPVLVGADGPANLLAAVRVAASAAARNLGVLVVLNDEIHAARFVRKANTSKPSAFVSALAGPLGFVVEDRVRIICRIDPQPTIRLARQVRDVRVALIKLGLDDDGRLIELAAESGYAGIVIEALGGGHASVASAERIGRAAAMKPIVLASRTGAGEVLANTYGFAGSEIDLVNRGVIRAGWLDSAKARVLLTLVLRHEARNVEGHFRAWDGGRID